MRLRYSFACKDCHNGWQVDLTEDAEADEHLLASICKMCGHQGEVRGMYQVESP